MNIALAELLFRVGAWVWDNVIHAEKNAELNSGDKKHKYVKQAVMREIDKELIDEAAGLVSRTQGDELRKLAATQVDRRIQKAVETLNKHNYVTMGVPKKRE